MTSPVYNLPADVGFAEDIDWRTQPDPDGDYDDELDDDDENIPTPQYVIDALGFDPDEWK